MSLKVAVAAFAAMVGLYCSVGLFSRLVAWVRGRPSHGGRTSSGTGSEGRRGRHRTQRPDPRNVSEAGIVLPDRSRHRATGRSPPAVPDPGQTSRILFYHRDEPYYEFTNFAPYAINWDGHTYPTAEHLFQAHKFMSTRADLAERIRRLHSSRAALEEAGRLRRLQRTDWFDVNIGVMDAVLEAKFTQHLKLRDLLLSTGHRELVEDSPVDSFWGWGNDCKGRNELGKALMRLRDKLRSTP